MNEREPTALEERIDMLTRELASKRRGTNWTSNLTLLLGLLVLILLCTYFGFGYYLANDVTQPVNVVRSARAMMDDYAKEARAAADDEIQKSSPVWAREVSNEFIVKMPWFREQAEMSLCRVLDEQMEQGRNVTTEQFERMLQENREEFKEAIETLSDSQDTEEFVNRVMPIVEAQYIPALRFDAIQVLGVMDDLNRRLDRLQTATDLNPIEEQQRHILGLARLLREKRAPETFDPGEIEAASNPPRTN